MRGEQIQDRFQVVDRAQVELGHISDALAAVQLTLTEEEVRRLEEPYLPHPVLGHS